MAGNEEGLQNVIGIDTSTAVMTTALLEQGRILASERYDAERNHSIKLVPAIQQLLKEHHWTAEQVDGIAVGIGPGSYTGVRIAVTAAKTIAWAWNKPIVGVSSVEALAWSGLAAAESSSDSDDVSSILGGAEYLVYPMTDARRGQVFTGCFRGRFATGSTLAQASSGVNMPSGVCERIKQDAIRLFSDVAAELAEELEIDKALQVLLVGETGIQQEQVEALVQRFGQRVHVVPCEVDAAWIAKLGAAALANGQADDVHRLEPNYTQLAEAEVKLNAKEKAAAQHNQQP
ncbi:tRNA (adenosine(37)-N6)-threonylcarbamoyltransferase complex dimerization subunit type 1 TsaB [Paenibacillus marinisediminis]